MRVPLILLFISVLSSAQDATVAIQHIQAQLTTTVKVAKAKEGDKLVAHTVTPAQLAGGQTVPAGSILSGRIMRVDKNALTILFDEVAFDHKRVPIAVTLSGLAWMGSGEQMSANRGNATVESPSAGSLPNDHPLNGSRYSVTEGGATELNGVGHQSLAEVNAKPATLPKTGVDVPGHPGSVIGLPGVKLTIDDEAPYSSRVDFQTKESQLPKGIQLMFSVR